MSEKLIKEIKERSQLFVLDNPKCNGLHVETAMLIGASIVFELEKD